MNLVWHIVRKDFRRLWVPLTLWWVMMIGSTLLLCRAATLEASPASFQGLTYFTGTWQVMIMAVGFVLAAWLVMEDSLVTTQAFWRTRPISGGRLLVAKAAGAVVFFSVLPVLVLTPVWVGAGFSWGELGRAAFDLAFAQALVSTLAILLAGITATSGQFLIRAVGLCVFLPLYLGFIVDGLGATRYGVTRDLAVSRFALVMGLILVMPVAVIVHQFITKRTLRSCAVGGLGLLLMFVIKQAWPWELSRVGADDVQETLIGAATRSGIEVHQRGVSTEPHPNGLYGRLIRLQGVTTGTPSGTYLRMNYASGAWLMKDKTRPLPGVIRPPLGSGRPPENAIRQVLGLPIPGESAEHWELEGREQELELSVVRAKGATLQYALNATLMQGQVLGELALKVGAELRIGSSYTKIIAIERRANKLFVHLLERDAWPSADAAFRPDNYGPLSPATTPWEDVFQAKGPLVPGRPILAANRVGTLRLNSLVFVQRELIVIPPTRERDGRLEEVPGWEQSTVIRKARFVPGSRFTRQLVAEPFAPAS
jgi:hypothetical protein